jgi:hypothetical protein
LSLLQGIDYQSPGILRGQHRSVFGHWLDDASQAQRRRCTDRQVKIRSSLLDYKRQKIDQVLFMHKNSNSADRL